jgi:hypothetical protein
MDIRDTQSAKLRKELETFAIESIPQLKKVY